MGPSMDANAMASFSPGDGRAELDRAPLLNRRWSNNSIYDISGMGDERMRFAAWPLLATQASYSTCFHA